MPNSQEDVRAEIEAMVSKNNSQTLVAQELGISNSYLHDILVGRREISQQVAAKLGRRRVILFPKIGDKKFAGMEE